jgi:hypothetical protein
MKITHANGYEMSRDFKDGRTRMGVTGIQERIRASPEAMFTALFNGATIEFAPDDIPISQDGELWLTELEIYGLLNVIRRSDKRSWFREEVFAALRECIKAFVEERRKPTQTPTHIAGREAYKRVTPGTDEMFREHADGGYELDEVGAIVVMVEAANAGDLTITPAQALRKAVEVFDEGHAQQRGIWKWSPTDEGQRTSD